MCKVEKSTDLFNWNGRLLFARCRLCGIAYNREYVKKNAVRLAAYRKEKYGADIEESRRKMREYAKTHPSDWYQRNRERARASDRAQYWADPEKYREKTARWRAANPEKAKLADKRAKEIRPEYRKNWRKKNPEKYKAESLRRRVRLSVGPVATADEIKARVEYCGGKCVYCGGAYEHLDHFVPLAKGGSNRASNLVPSCEKCNLAKAAKKPGKWTVEKLGQGLLFI